MVLESIAPEEQVEKAGINYAAEAVRRKGIDTDWTLYQLINKRPRLNVYELAKILGWSSGKVYGSIKRLEKQGLVLQEKSMKNGRAVLLVSAVKWQQFFTSEELEEFRKMDI